MSIQHQKWPTKNLDIENKTKISALTEDSDQPVPKGLDTLRGLQGESMDLIL